MDGYVQVLLCHVMMPQECQESSLPSKTATVRTLALKPCGSESMECPHDGMRFGIWDLDISHGPELYSESPNEWVQMATQRAQPNTVIDVVYIHMWVTHSKPGVLPIC